jgi:peptidyl-prolyl cis-trans isomerase A (cyclophilin A)
MRVNVSLLGGCFLMLGVSCKSGAAPEPEGRKAEAVGAGTPAAAATPAPTPTPTPAPTPAPAPKAPTTAEVVAAPGDPVNGKFTLDDATAGLPKDGKLVAEIDTDKGKLECELYGDKAPITVANFVGLARGLRPWKKGSEWVKTPLYDGTPFHRIIKGFMIQGGDPNGNGSGGPGYEIPDEIWEGAHHNEIGQLCMANRGKNTNGSQFFIMDGVANHLDGGYTIFGKCGPEKTIEAIADSKVSGDRAVDPPKVKKITVKRKK